MGRRPLTHRKALREIEDVLWASWAMLVEVVQGSDDATLSLMEKASESLSQTNCGWLLYRMRGDLLQLVRDEMTTRVSVPPADVDKTEVGA